VLPDAEGRHGDPFGTLEGKPVKTRPSLPGMMVLLVVACAGAGVRDWPDEEREGIRIN